jgi:UDP-N-acetylmuramate: L-alanyl-gamma-D-glutamyl-meso-diaminopimelate ligase
MLPKFQSVHFIGICGTAMASAAAALKEQGVQVTGSDQNVYPPMSTFLAECGIEVSEGYHEGNLAGSPDLVVIGNAVSRGNLEAEIVLEKRLKYCSLPELLKTLFIGGKRSIVIAGTHGKTTTASLLAWVFECNGLNPGYLIGGIPNNFSKGARFNDSEWFIVEGDEYDTAFFDKRSKFVHYLPEIVLINNIEFDHADIFEDLSQIQTSFRRLVGLVPRNGLLVVNEDDKNIAPLLNIQHCPVKHFGIKDVESVAHVAGGIEFSAGGFQFHLPLFGELNVRNALGVIVIGRHCGLTNQQIQSGFDTFKGVKRRMEVRGEFRGVTVVDDFAHHPTSIRETLKAAKVRFPGQRLWAVFEPRSNTTRRNIFQEELVGAFIDADLVILSEVARLDQIPESERLDLETLINRLKNSGKAVACAAGAGAIVEHLEPRVKSGDVVCVLSNGDFGNIHERLLEMLKA